MQTTGTAGPCAHSELVGQHAIGAGGKAARFFVSNMDKPNLASTDCVGNVVERIPRHSVAAFDAGLFQCVYDDFCDCAAHEWFLLFFGYLAPAPPMDRSAC